VAHSARWAGFHVVTFLHSSQLHTRRDAARASALGSPPTPAGSHLAARVSSRLRARAHLLHEHVDLAHRRILRDDDRRVRALLQLPAAPRGAKRAHEPETGGWRQSARAGGVRCGVVWCGVVWCGVYVHC
jgi:hypothetical protein